MKLNVGVIGYGYWGPNIVRNFNAIEGVKVSMICDRSSDALKRARKAHPHIGTCRDYHDITASAGIDVIAVVTPVSTHYALAKEALENGKHIFVEKPFTATVAEAEKLISLAARKKRKIMVDHTFIFTGAVKKIKELVDSHALGRLYYYDSTRVNLGLFQHDVNVVWDLAPHDFSVMNYVIKEKPYAVVAHGADHFGRSLEDIAYITVYFRDNLIAHFNVNWLSPVKIRMTLIGGAKKMLVWNDLDTDEKIKIYNKGVDVKGAEGLYKLLVDYRSGDMWAPRVENAEALKTELEYFVDCIKKNRTPVNDAKAGLDVVRMLEASDRSLRQNGKMIKL
ncbi:MAG: Gfo/Idh/MocA family oxidoreductase [Candidatus Omnitrophica bacterium]|nr:Gfo/Idh/MocA family oxidoreductase [Candidatus Omnitrophota bacterium]MBU1808968.1 Gfo/Idh/MocA family oxidoreductase [Candidatus Omnitrophota bacterium]